MGELHAYALGVEEVRGLAHGAPAQQDRLRTLAGLAAGSRRPTLLDVVGPIYRRVPGRRVLLDAEPAPADLDTLLAGDPVPPARAAATWRLVETLVAASALAATRVQDAEVPTGLLAALPLSVPGVDGRAAGWCSADRAAAVEGLRGWLAGRASWAGTAEREGRPAPDVVVFLTR